MLIILSKYNPCSLLIIFPYLNFCSNTVIHVGMQTDSIVRLYLTTGQIAENIKCKKSDKIEQNKAKLSKYAKISDT